MPDKERNVANAPVVETVDLPNDHGHMIRVHGSVVAEDMHFNDKNGMLTVEKVYDAGEGRIAYAAISAIDDRRDRRAYVIEERDDRCLVSNGSITLDVLTGDLIHLLSLGLAASAASAEASAELEHIQRKLAANA